jgi:hypothetical protein
MPLHYYKIEAEIANPYTICEVPDIPTESWDDLSITFNRGTSISAKVPNPLEIIVNYPKSSVPAPYLESIYPVVNDDFIRAMKMADTDNYQIFPAILKTEDLSHLWQGYFAFNVIGLLDAALLKKCKYDIIMEGNDEIPPVMGFHHYVFSAEKLKNKPHMFRLWQSSDDLFISDHVMKVLKSIMPLDKWNITATEVEVK